MQPRLLYVTSIDDLNFNEFYQLSSYTEVMIDPLLSSVEIARIVALLMDYEKDYTYHRPLSISIGFHLIFDYFTGVLL